MILRGVKMREPYQILSIPYRIVDDTPLFCIFRRADSSYWQFIAGGGENGETPLQATIRETIEEISVEPFNIQKLESVAYVPAEVIAEKDGNIGIKTLMLYPNIRLLLSVIRISRYQKNIMNINGSLTMKQENC